ncbi:MAG TPA: heme o synthase [Azospirillaceae bacterium]|nr:heme o synthase [Azospirillaceae bacterium]
MTDTALDTGARAHTPSGSVRDFIELLKPRVMSLVVFSGVAGMVVAPGELHPVLALTAILCIAVASGAAGAVNMWYDRDIDAVMARTAARPIPEGRVDPDEALAFGVVLSIAPVMLMGLALNWTAAAILALASAFYIFVYTIWLKRRTPQNIVIGGAAGAFPPVIGWAAVTGDVSVGSLLLFALIFFWTPPHFWALALYRKIDYARAGVPMLPVVAGERATKVQMLVYTLLLLPIAVGPYFVGIGGPVYLAGSIVLGLLFVLCAVRVLRDETQKSAKQMFTFSLLYLFLLFALMIGERLAG